MKSFFSSTLAVAIIAFAVGAACGDGSSTDGEGAGGGSGGEGASGGEAPNGGAPAGGAPAGGSSGEGASTAERRCEDTFPAVSFATDVQPILTSSCAKSTCHAGFNPDAGLDLREGNAHASLVDLETTQCSGSRTRVVPGDLEESYMFHKLLGTDMCGNSRRMPLGGAPLSAEKLDIIAAWICGGARND